MTPKTATPPGRVEAPEGQVSAGLARALERIFRNEERPEVLDLGPLCGDSVIYLADRGARVTVDELVPPPPRAASDDDESAVAPLRIDQPDERYDLVLAWEILDFTPPDRIEELGRELGRILKDRGWLLLLARNGGGSREEVREPGVRYRILADDRVQRESTGGGERPRWTYSNRDIERALHGFSIQGIQLGRNQMREISALRKS